MDLIYDCCPVIKEYKESFLLKYLQRIFFTNAFLFQKAADFIFEHTDLKDEDLRGQICSYSVIFGMMHQVVNDIADYVPSHELNDTAAKSSADSLKDLLNLNITLPTFIHLHLCPDGEISNFLKTTASGKDKAGAAFNEQICVSEIGESTAIYYCLKITMQMRQLCLSQLGILPNSNHYLVDHSRIAETNKYYNYWFQQRNHKGKNSWKEFKKNSRKARGKNT